MKARLVVPLKGGDHKWQPVGTVIEHPDAYRLVRHGCAEPADEECEQAADMTPEALAKAQAAYPKIAAGIIPEDREAWDLGYMRGYNADGSWIPGPQFEEMQEEEWRQRANESGIVLP
jgi:hypothetical protein